MLASLTVLFLLQLPVDVTKAVDFQAVISAVDEAGKDGGIEAVHAAAKKALESNKAVLGTGDGVFYRGLLEARAGDDKKALDTLLGFAKGNPESSCAEKAKFEALMVSMSSEMSAKDKLAIADSVDASKLDENQAPMVDMLKQRLASDMKLEGLVGMPVPQFKVNKSLNGNFDWADTKGKVLVIDFWATWCPPCRMVIPELVAMQKEHGDKVMVIGATRFYGYGMDFSDPEAKKPHGGKQVGSRKEPMAEEAELAVNEAFIKSFELNYPVVFTDAPVSKEQFFVSGIPTVFVVGKSGKITGSVVGAGEDNHRKLVSLVKNALNAPAN